MRRSNARQVDGLNLAQGSLMSGSSTLATGEARFAASHYGASLRKFRQRFASTPKIQTELVQDGISGRHRLPSDVGTSR